MNELNYLFLGVKIKKMGEKISSQIKKILAENQIDIDLRTLWLMSLLQSHSKVSINELAEILSMTHPAIVQIINSLKNSNRLELKKSEADKRVTEVSLSEGGIKYIESMLPFLYELNKSIKEFVDDNTPGIENMIEDLNGKIDLKSLRKKTENKLKEDFLTKVKIVPFKRKYKKTFKTLNYEWLNEYFEVEEEDKKQLLNPEQEIIKKGGEIFFAVNDGSVIGTCAMIKCRDDSFELAKMVVAKNYRGKHVGRKLALTCIGFAVTNNAKRITLSTNKKLYAALSLYKSLGFTEVTKKQDSRYKRELIYLELNLT